MSPVLKRLMLATDIGLLGYWAATALAALGLVNLPPEWLYSDYHNAQTVAWNWSFLPLDVMLSAFGLASVRLAGHGNAGWQRLALVSLALTSCAGLMAVSFWAIRGEFDPAWWAVNLFLLMWPLPYLAGGLRAQ